MNLQLFDYHFLIGMEQVFFFLLGCLTCGGVLYVFAPAIAKRERAKKISRIKQVRNLQNSVCSLTDELYYFRTRYMNALESFKKIDKHTKELGDTIITLSQEKDKLLDEKKLMEVERNHYYIETDRLKAEICKITRKEYSGKSVSEEGKIE